MIKRKVEHLINRYKTNDPYEIASKKNIIVLFELLGNTLGYFHTFKRIKIIHINKNLDKYLQRFVCAHELGHAILHKEINTPFLKKNTLYSVQKIEVEANTFAVELLLPDDIINEYKREVITAEKIASLHGIPREVIGLKKFNFF